MTSCVHARLLSWLQAAYLMEDLAQRRLRTILCHIRHRPTLRARIAEHLADTRVQADELAACIERLGGGVPDTAGLPAGVVPSTPRFDALRGGAFLRCLEISQGLEDMEAATYCALIDAAEAAGEPRIAAVCQRLLHEELTMAEWLRDYQDAMLRRLLGQDAAQGVLREGEDIEDAAGPVPGRPPVAPRLHARR